MEHDEFQENDGFRRAGPGNKHRRQKHGRRWLVSPWLLGIILEGIAIAALVIWVTLLEKDALAHVENENHLGKMLQDSKAELEALKYDINEEKNMEREGCLPKLLTLKLDEVMSINRDYVKSAMFTVSGKKNKKVLEYRVVLQNTASVNLAPRFDIIFFNTMGNRIGAASFGQDGDDSKHREILEKGETRSIDGSYETTDQALPESIMVKVIDEK
ncbi:MAG: hypothetical protein ACKN9T_15900 [Candidatus Methylumidiphilus sp.]